MNKQGSTFVFFMLFYSCAALSSGHNTDVGKSTYSTKREIDEFNHRLFNHVQGRSQSETRNLEGSNQQSQQQREFEITKRNLWDLRDKIESFQKEKEKWEKIYISSTGETEIQAKIRIDQLRAHLAEFNESLKPLKEAFYQQQTKLNEERKKNDLYSNSPAEWDFAVTRLKLADVQRKLASTKSQIKEWRQTYARASGSTETKAKERLDELGKQTADIEKDLDSVKVTYNRQCEKLKAEKKLSDEFLNEEKCPL